MRDCLGSNPGTVRGPNEGCHSLRLASGPVSGVTGTAVVTHLGKQLGLSQRLRCEPHDSGDRLRLRQAAPFGAVRELALIVRGIMYYPTCA